MKRTAKNRIAGVISIIVLLFLIPTVAVFTAEDDMPVFTENEFDNCIFGPGMECYAHVWSDSDQSGVEAYCGDEGAGAQIVKPVVIYYKNTDAANANFQDKMASINESISFFDGGCPDNDTCKLLDSDEESSEIGYLGYYTNNDYSEYYSGGYTLLYGNYYAFFQLHGYAEHMNQEQAEQYYATAKECLKNIVMQDACRGVKIPMPERAEEYDIEVKSVSPIPGSDPEKISPVGLGSLATGGDSMSLPVRLCPFEEPVDIAFGFDGMYMLNSRNKVTSLDQIGQVDDFVWKKNVTEEIDETIPWGFGGLFPNNKLPKGDYSFEFYAFPSGENFDNSTPSYSWNYVVSVECEDVLPLPEEKRFFFVRPQAFPTTGSDPAQINPFGINTYAVGGKMLMMEADFCLADDVDIYFGMYCPLTDPFNIYFANGKAKTKEEMFQKVSLLQFLFARELPPEPFSEDDWFDPSQNSPVSFFAGTTTGIPFDIPQRYSVYILAVTPKGVRDKFYAWIMPLNLDIKDAFEKFYTSKRLR